MRPSAGRGRGNGEYSVKPVKVGICGLGTVGGGTFNVLKRNADEISRRAGPVSYTHLTLPTIYSV